MQRITVKRFEDGKFPKLYTEQDKYYWNLDPENPFLVDLFKGSEGKSFDVETTLKKVPRKDGGRDFSVTVVTSAKEPSSPPPSVPAQTVPPLRSKDHLMQGSGKDIFRLAIATSTLTGAYAIALANNGNFQGMPPGDIEGRVWDFWLRKFNELKFITGIAA